MELTGLVASKYRIEAKVGFGGMGEVYRAHDTRLDRAVAIKTILAPHHDEPHARERFLRETRLACRVSHPYVATVHEVIEHEGLLLLVMEFLEGRELGDVLKNDRPPVSDVVPWLIEVAEALHAIHEAGVIHRDIKPANVMITANGHVKVTDFGLARKNPVADPDATTETEEARMTRPGAFAGTMLYSSPEQLRGDRVDARSDQFSFGILAWEALTGVHPFVRPSAAESISAILSGEPASGESAASRAIPDRLARVIERSLRKDAADRFADSRELLHALREAAAETAPGPPRPRKTLGFAAALLAVGIVAFSAFVWLNRPPVWPGERYVIAVAPFRPADGDAATEREAGLVTDLLTRDLQASRLIRAEGPEQMQLAGLAPAGSLSELGVKIATAREVDYIVLGSLRREESSWVASATLKPAREGEETPPPLEVRGDEALAVAEKLAAGLRRRLPEVSPLTAYRDDRVDLAASTSESADALAAFETGLRALREGRFVAAVEALQQAADADPEFALAHTRLADALDAAGYGRRAREAAARAQDRVSRAATRAGSDRLTMTVRATRARVFGDTGEWVAVTNALVESFPNEPSLMLEHAAALSESNRDEDALGLLDEALLVDAYNPTLRLKRAQVLIRLRRHDDARRALEELRARFELLSSEEGLAAVELAGGDLYTSLEDYGSAVESYERASQRYTAVARPISAAEAALASQSVLLLQQRYAEAEQRIDLASTIADESGNLRLRTRALVARATLSYYRRDWDAAIRFYREAVDEARRLENARLMSAPLTNMVNLLVWLRRTGDILPALQEAQAVAAELGDPDLLASMVINEAEIAAQQGDLAHAIDTFERLIDPAESHPARMRILGQLGLAAILRERGRYGDALQQLDRAVELARELDRPMDVGRALQNRAWLRSALGDPEGADRDLAQAAAFAEEFPDIGRAVGLMRRIVNFHRGDWSETLEGLEDYQDNFERAVLACGARYHLGKPSEAQEACTAGIAQDDVTPSERAVLEAWLALVRADTGDPAEAVALATGALEAAGRMGLLPVEVLAAAALCSVPADRRPDNWRELAGRGRRALESWVGASPATNRESVRTRPDVKHAEARIASALE